MPAPPHAASAANRFGLGARPGTLDRIDDPRGHLLAQLRAPANATAAAFAGLPSSADYLTREADYTRERLLRRRAQRVDTAMPDATRMPTGLDDRAADPAVREAITSFRDAFGADQRAELAAREAVALTTPRDFVERLVRFWSNHFAISIDKRPAALYAAPMEREAIRPHVLGRFEDMLLAVESHPGMLRYLDNAQSVGEGSPFARRGARRLARDAGGDGTPKRRFGLNENLAREILELHTLGVDGGYAQDDVTELARAITGWSTPVRRDARDGADTGAFVFRDAAHEPGARRVLGRSYADGGQEQGRAVLRDLARHPATARHLAFKLARHFVGDVPPPALVDDLARTWLRHDGDLVAVYRALVGHDLAWAPDARKFKTPADFVVSALRALDGGQSGPERVAVLLRPLGQPPFTPRSPAGFADTVADWAGPDALFKRVQAAQALAERAPASLPPLDVAQAAFGASLDAELATAIRRAESQRQALALLFASPQFQWRA